MGALITELRGLLNYHKSLLGSEHHNQINIKAKVAAYENALSLAMKYCARLETKLKR